MSAQLAGLAELLETMVSGMPEGMIIAMRLPNMDLRKESDEEEHEEHEERDYNDPYEIFHDCCDQQVRGGSGGGAPVDTNNIELESGLGDIALEVGGGAIAQE
jgi:hypothetical protein